MDPIHELVLSIPRDERANVADQLDRILAAYPRDESHLAHALRDVSDLMRAAA